MKNFLRLLRYGLPYSFQWFAGVILLAAVGALDTFRVLLLQPIFDKVLDPKAPEGPITLGLSKEIPIGSAHYALQVDLRALIPSFFHIHNSWAVVAFALVVSTLFKGICDYTGIL